MAASVAIVTVAASAATAVRVVRAKKKSWRKRSKNHGRSWCTPSVFPPPQDLPVHGPKCAENRLQGFQAVDALRLRARQDRAEPHHCRLRQEAARTRARHQALAFPRPASLRDPLAVIPGRSLCAKLTKSILSLSERTRNPEVVHVAGFRVRAKTASRNDD